MSTPEPQLQAPEGINIQPVPDSEVPGQAHDPGDVPNHQAADLGADMPLPPEPPQPRTNLGANTRRSSGVRQLGKKDREALLGLYGSLALTVSLIHKDGAEQIAESSESCVDAWMELAKQNDSVRRAILAALEGSAWSAVVAAHLPIMLAFVPRNALERMPLLFNPNMNGDGADMQTETHVYEEGQTE